MINLIPFDLKKAAAGELVTTRSGRRAINIIDNTNFRNSPITAVLGDNSFFCTADVRGRFHGEHVDSEHDLFMVKTVSTTEITNEEAMHWLKHNDPEYNWESHTALIDAVRDNLHSFGEERQSGHIHVIPDLTLSLRKSFLGI